jgi:hypothetical protein
MAKQSVTVRLEPELLRWFRDEAQLPLGQAVNEGLRQLQLKLLTDRLNARVDRELRDGESLVSQDELDAWTSDEDGDG